MRTVIQMYAILYRDAYAEPPTNLLNFFMMTKNGRLVVRPRHDGVDGESPAEARHHRTVKAKELAFALQIGMTFSDYERYLVDAMRHVDSGNANLAVVQAVMILDWFANTILGDRIIRPLAQRLEDTPELSAFVVANLWETKYKKKRWTRVSTIDKFAHYFPLAGITVAPKLFKDLEDIIKLRNQIVHERQSEPLEAAIAINALETAMGIVRSAMMQMRRATRRAGTGR